jgi:hypothetical protein
MTGPARTSEFDRFGPWVDAVATPDDVPRLYRTHRIDVGSARVVLKVPRNIARRDATADMDLYDHLLVLDDEHLTVLSRNVGTQTRGRVAPPAEPYGVRRIRLAQIVAVRNVSNLLDASLTVQAADGSATSIRYSGSARDTIEDLVDALRPSAAPAAPGSAVRALQVAARAQEGQVVLPGPDDQDVALAKDFHRLARRNPRLVAWGWHGRRRLAPRGTGLPAAVARVGLVFSPVTMHGAVLGADDRALEVVGRHAFLVSGRVPVYSLGRLVVPFATLASVAVSQHPGFAGAVSVVLRAGESRITLVVPEGSPEHTVFAAASNAS